MYDPGNEPYVLTDAVMANVMEYVIEEDMLESAKLLAQIFNDLDQIKIRLEDMEEDVKNYRRRAIKAELELKKFQRKENEES